MKYSILFIPFFVASCNGGVGHMSTSNGYDTQDFESNGERIYFTGTSASGDSIYARGGSVHMRMHSAGCVSCHGTKREGRRLWPQFWIKAPSLTAEALFTDDAHNEGSDKHGDHGSYDSLSLRRAITKGIDPAGKPLDSTMPRWSMNPSDMDDLIAYLQQTHSHD